MAAREQESYRQIFKSTSLFGGVQVFNVLISIVRSKFVALLIGPAGMGITGLLTSATGFVSAFTGFGLGTSAVKNISSVAATGDEAQISKVVVVLRRLTMITGVLGMVLTASLSPWLSEITFGNKDYTYAFIWISVTLLFQQLSSGQMVVLQGLRKLHFLAKANALGSLIGLLIAVPIYYLWRIKGIVPVIIISSLTTMILSAYFTQKAQVRSVIIPTKEIISESKEMLKMGFAISISGLIAAAVSFIVRIYINNSGGVEEVGLYNAGFAIIGTYVGMIFTAMSTEYYPRLSAVAYDNFKCRDLINQQAEVAILIISPILAVFLIYSNLLIVILYSGKFIAVKEMICWAALGMYFKAASWSVSIVILAKGASKLYFWNELVANLYILTFNIIGYMLAGLAGLGISFMLAYIVYFIQVDFLARIKYSFSFKQAFYKVSGLQFLLGLICFVVITSLNSPWSFIIGSFFIIISLLHSFRELNKRISLVSIIRRQIGKFSKS